MLNSIRWMLICLPFVAAAVSIASESRKDLPPGTVETRIGIEGTYYLRYSGPELTAKPVDEDAPIILRIANVTADGDSTIYELRFIGQHAGSFDLRGSLNRSDGKPIRNLPPAMVAIRESLPKNHAGNLEDLAPPAIRQPLPYRVIMFAAGVLWLVAVVWLIVRRLRNRPQRTATEEAAPITFADQLRPLVETAISGRMTPAEQGRLEWLLIAFWRERLELTGLPPLESLQRMREHAEAAVLLMRLEEWLHQRPGTNDVNVAELLAPYRSAAIVHLPERKPEGVPA